MDRELCNWEIYQQFKYFLQGILNDIYQDGVVWHDIACYHTKPYVCEDSDQLLDFVRASLKAKGSDMVIPEPPEELEVDP